MSPRRRLFWGGAILLVLLFLALGAAKGRLALDGKWEGLFLLREADESGVVLANKLFLGEEGRLIGGWTFPGNEDPSAGAMPPQEIFLELEWNKEGGYGLVRSHFGEGRVLQTHFSRYIDSTNRRTSGLFVGGATTAALTAEESLHRNDSGMAYFDGQAWQHIWCNTNEGIGSLVNYQNSFAPSAWAYRGSDVLENSPDHVVLTSYHEVRIDDIPLNIERVVDFTAGERYFNLAIKITNIGSQPAYFYYYYGDEPWVGDFGGSSGDIGWTADHLVRYEEVLDPGRHSFAGMVDYGNEAVGEGKGYRHSANFIAWFEPNKPNRVFFANHYEGFSHSSKVLVPLVGDARSIGMYWGPRTIYPGETQSMLLAVGMAQWAPERNSPVLPVVNTNRHRGHLLMGGGGPPPNR